MRKKPVQRRSRQMVDNIVEAAAKVVGEEGLAALTTNRVAEVAGISNGSLYQYFHDRQDLLQALTAKVSDDVMALVNLRLPPVALQARDARSLVRLAMKIVLDFMRARPLYLELIRNWDEVPLAVFLEPMERFWLNRAQQYVVQATPGRVVPQLHARFYVQFNSVFFNLLRYASEPTPWVSEDELLDALADSVALMLLPADAVPVHAG